MLIIFACMILASVSGIGVMEGFTFQGIIGFTMAFIFCTAQLKIKAAPRM